MINVGDSEILLQLVSGMKDQIVLLEKQYVKNDINSAIETKKIILKLQKQINQLVEENKK